MMLSSGAPLSSNAQESTPIVAIVVLNWNGLAHLQNFLPLLVQRTPTVWNGAPVSLVVADNHSSDGSQQWVTSRFPSVELIQLPQNFGFAEGYNQALKQVSAKYFLLLNSDVEVSENWLTPMLQLMEANPQIGACQPLLKMYANKKQFEYAGAAGGWLDAYGYPFARGRIFDFCETDHQQYQTSEPIGWAGGAAILVQAELYRKLGGLDPVFFAHQEEIDLCWRIQLEGYQVFVCATSVVYHVGGGTLPKGNAKKVYLNFRNNLMMLCKNMPLQHLFWKLPFRLFLDAISAWKSLLAGEKAYFFAIAKAHFALFKWLLSSKKNNRFPSRRGYPTHGYYRGSIVWQHFVKGKTTFSQIITPQSTTP